MLSIIPRSPQLGCQSRLSCEECSKLHPTLLHVAKPVRPPTKKNQPGDSNKPAKEPSKEESTNANTSVNNDGSDRYIGATTCMVVPVILSHKEKPSVEINTYALLDNGSDSTFIKSATLSKLEVDGPDITLKLNTMYGQTEIAAKKIEDLVVQHISKAEAPITLPKAYSRDVIPPKRSQIPTPEVVNKWPHFGQIKDQLLPLQEGMKIGILIGCNCPKANKPRDVILGGEDDPYAVKTSLGWGVIGPSNSFAAQERDHFTTCHCLVTHEIGSQRLDSRFALDARTKEIIKPSDVGRMFEIDFSEKDRPDKAFSQVDRKFLADSQEWCAPPLRWPS